MHLTRSSRSRAALMVALAGATLAASAANAQPNNIFVGGTINWTDPAGTLHAARNVPVEIWFTRLIGSDVLVGSTNTDAFGGYSTSFFSIALGMGSYIKFGSSTSAGTVGPNLGNNLYLLQTPNVGIASGENTINVNLPAAGAANRAFAVADGMYTAWGFVNDARGAAPIALNARFPGGSSGYTPHSTQFTLLDSDAHDPDVTTHEYMHYAQEIDRLADPDITGGHSSGISSIPTLGKRNGARLGWSEGTATYFGVASQRHRPVFYGHPLNYATFADTRYTDAEAGGTLSYDLEGAFHSGGRSSSGEGDELAVSRVMWDIGDATGGAAEPFDRIDRGRQQIYRDLQAIVTADAGPVMNLSRVWNHYAGTVFNTDAGRANLGAIFEANSVSPHPSGGAIGQTFDVTLGELPTFTWARQNNGDNDTFSLILFNSDLSARLLPEIAIAGDVTSYSLAAALMNQIINYRGTVKFVITGADFRDGAGALFASAEERTGRYWSDAYSFNIIPTPGTAFLAGLAGLCVSTRRRRAS